MANVKNNTAAQETQRRLLRAAGEIFAERGFHAATIKEITDRAGASLASVNYHFRDKAELYAAVLKRIGDECAGMIPPDDALVGPAKDRFRQYIAYFFERAMGRNRQPWEQMLLAREFAEPTPAMHDLMRSVFQPLHEKLSTIIAELLDRPRSEKSVALATASVLGQCIYYMKYYRLLGIMHPTLGENPDVEQLANYIADFSLRGLKTIDAPKQKKRREVIV